MENSLLSKKLKQNLTTVLFTTLIFVTVTTAMPIKSQTIEETIKSTTVQINSKGNLSPGGSGVIIEKKGNIYTVLTVNHAVCDELLGRKPVTCATDINYTIRTDTGQEYPLKTRRQLRKNEQDPDLAIVTFEARENYPVATLGNSDDVKIGADIVVAGFPSIFGKEGSSRTYAATPGKIVTMIPDGELGYTLVYNATTFIGNSGGPVFDNKGQVVAIHGLADSDDDYINRSEVTTKIYRFPFKKWITEQNETGITRKGQKTGFNAGIPINTFLSLKTKINIEPEICNLQPVNGQVYEDIELQTLANQITVKIFGQQDSGSGTIIGKDYDSYLVLINPRILSKINIYTPQVQTHDGKIYHAKSVKIFDNLDLATLEFASNQSYCVAKKINTANINKNTTILAAGYSNSTNRIAFKTGKVEQIISQPVFKYGYEIGYSSDIEQGMSGGAILNHNGYLIGINGRSSYPIRNWYVYADGKKPTNEEILEFRKLSWFVPTTTFLNQIKPEVIRDYNLSLMPKKF